MSRLADFISPRLPTEQDVYNVITGAHTDVAEDWVKGEIWREVNGQLVPVALPHTLTPDDPSDITQFLDGVGVDHNESRDVMRQATFHLEEYPGLGDFNTLTDLMRLYHCFNDVNGEMILKIPVGVFCFMLPDRTLDPAGNSWDITGYDLAWRIQILGFDTVYTVPQGVKVTDAMKVMLMADKLPPSEGGRQPAGVPTAGSTQSTLPVYSGGSPAYTSVGVPCTSVGTLDAQGFIVMPNGLRYNPYSGAQVDPVTYAPIDPLTLVPMIQVKTVAGVLVPNTFYSSGFTRAWYQTAMGCFISPYDVNAAPIQASTNPIFILDIYKNVQLLRTTQTAMQSPYKSPVYLSGFPCPLATWPYDYDHSGPYFGDQMIQPAPSTGGTTGTTTNGNGAGYCPSGYAVADPRSGCHYVTVTWPGGMQVTGYFTGVVNGQVGPDTLHYNPNLGTKVDPATGMPIDPNTCLPMAFSTFTTPSGGSFQAPVCANGAAYDTMLGCFYVNQSYSAPGIYSDITYVNPVTLVALNPQPGQDNISGFTCNSLNALGGDGGVGTQSGSTGTVTPTSTGTAVPWPDANNPGMTPAGCDFFGPGLDASRIKIPDSDLLTPGPMKFDDKMGFIAAWNSLAGLINYYPLGFDSNGNAVSGPVPWQYTDAQGNAYIPTEVDWTYGSDAAGTMKTPIKVRINDMTALANMVKLKVQSNKGAAPIYVRKLNRSPNSMMAIQNLGYVLPKTIQNDKIVDLQVAIDTVEVELEYASLAEQAVDFSGPIIPLHDLHWLIYINYYGTDGTLEIDCINNPYPFSEGAWKIDFQNEDHEHQVGRRVGI